MSVESYGKKLTAEYKLKRMIELDFLEFDGPVDLTNADNSFYLLEYYGTNPNEASDQPELIFFGRWVYLRNYNWNILFYLMNNNYQMKMLFCLDL